MTTAMTYAFATGADASLLGELNLQLIHDEGHRNLMTAGELAERMRDWLATEYKAVIFRSGGEECRDEIAAYGLYRESATEVYLRQFFVQRHLRRTGIGRECMRLLREHIWPANKRITVDVLCHNASAMAFWRSIGFQDYCLTLEIRPAVSL
ncbi:MAG TPA: GNAT family N-acetyltransferase [Candidatus Methylacidiphilales bacterium]|nr:GNAT family N-acetyltransferase [Candidatus Methylacidiphilales bacterium]